MPFSGSSIFAKSKWHASINNHFADDSIKKLFTAGRVHVRGVPKITESKCLVVIEVESGALIACTGGMQSIHVFLIIPGRHQRHVCSRQRHVDDEHASTVFVSERQCLVEKRGFGSKQFIAGM